MPNWKKVITSGSDAALNSLNVTTSLTASGLIYPASDGIDNQVLKTDGSGNLFFDNVLTTTISIKNVSGGTIAKGTPCYITGSGTSGNVAGVWPADASNPARMPAGIIAGETLNDGDEGIGLLNGFINGVNTSAFQSGDSIYVKAGGGYTNTRPTGSTIFVQKLGNVEKVDVSNGSGVVHGPGYYNDLPNVQQGYTWVGNADGVATAIATSSIQNVVSASFASTASYVNTLNQIVRVGNDIELDNQIGAVVANSFDAGLGNVFIDGLTGDVAATSFTAGGGAVQIDGITGEVTATTFIGNLTGTASYATQALSASWAPGGNPFPFTGDAQISGSLGVTGSFSVLDSIDGTNKILIGSGPIPGSTEDSVNWDSRTLFDSNGNFSVRWGALRTLFDSSTVSSLDWGSRIIYDSNASHSIDWNNRQLKFDNGSNDYTVDWSTGILQDTATKASIDWQNRQLKDINADTILNWSSGVSITGSFTISGSSTFTNIGPARFSGSFVVQGDIIPGSPPFIPDVGPYDAIKVDDVADQRLLYGTPFLGASASLDFGNRMLLDPAGVSVLQWDGTVGYINSELYSNSRINATTRNTLLNNIVYAGQTLDEVTFDSTVADFDLVYLSTGSTWFPVNQATDSSTKLLGICLGYDPMTYLGTVILEGDVSVSTGPGSTPVVDNANYGLPVYIAYGAGNTMDTTIPVNGYVRVLGHCYHNDGANNWIMKFRPSNDWIEI